MKRFCHSLKCWGRRCDCSDDSDSDGQTLPLAKVASKGGHNAPPTMTYPKNVTAKAPKPGKDPKPAEPKNKVKPQEAATGNDGKSRTEITPDMSDIDMNDASDGRISDNPSPPRSDSDIDMPDADPGELLTYPLARMSQNRRTLSNAGESESSSDDDALYFGSPRPRPPISLRAAHQSGRIERWSLRSSNDSMQSYSGRKRGHVEEVEDVNQEWSPAPSSHGSPPSKRQRTSGESSTEGRFWGPELLFPEPPTSPNIAASSDSEDFNTDDEMYEKPSTTTINRYREKGAQLQAWLEDPNEPDCNISPATATLDDLMNAPPPDVFELGESYHRDLGDLMDGGEPESTGLPTGGNSEIQLPKSEYDNIQWNEFAKAVYEYDHPMSTLRLGRDFEAAMHESCMKVERGTAEYEELLGTKLGKAAAILLISSLPRETAGDD
ncbi:hypothetical protein CBS147333_5331 [Penicillium roqueforti]|uniref:uncharacterized protein n=1 Tax=Penicillium roqueforti TaxID=5082 RepID=UPI00190CF198|nr:uncharacterized protein LCP9604111_1970 [Penicillium roqueforti]KAF9251974.1 hypothetical protein LCP9604111_1970 [Penicillium roqueforti]KAI2728102.1 hypothetical protein CBS147354_2635 [Penicillium roqueforti]KAI3109684.1 hypothetical protein CBS147333_5331 [Penicillium roqueforti]KAI3139691.1 hypothetical protein CBS147330_1541 [Penicillium roqueforti]KAI3144864.1 hypothetical protein CBS147325_5049 [Penicillium roqueforti]